MIRLALIALIFALSVSAYAQELPPLPTMPAAIDESAAEIGSAIDELPEPGTLNGVSLVPEVDAGDLFKYMKWIMSPASTRELLGEDFAPFGDATVNLVLLMAVMTLIYLAIRGIVLLFRLMILLINLAIQMAQLVIAVADLIWPG